jgi:hypothetical protein
MYGHYYWNLFGIYLSDVKFTVLKITMFWRLVLSLSYGKAQKWKPTL